ncbi:MAG: two-component regulator propeller domain-containing protein [Armatimonadota bacterium]
MDLLLQTEAPVTSLAYSGEIVHAAVGERVLTVGIDGGAAVVGARDLPSPAVCLAAGPDGVAAFGAFGAVLARGALIAAPPSEGFVSATVGPDGSMYAVSKHAVWTAEAGSWSRLTVRQLDPGAEIRSIACDSHGHLYLATSCGLYIVCAGFAEHIGGSEGLPCEDVRSVALCGESIVLATALGAVVYRDGRWRLYAGQRWLPDGDVHCAVLDRDGCVWIGTSAGPAVVQSVEMTLEEKAGLFLEKLRARHVRQGYVTSCILQRPGDLDSFIYEASDNDGLWTALYVAAESFRYAVTKAPDAAVNARESLNALIRLQEVTPIPGYPARAYVSAGETVVKSSGEWHSTEDGSGEWKGDTSSDELDGHFFAFSTYYDLVADELEKARVAQAASAISDHLIRNGFLLIDVDRKHTTWGVFAPELLNGPWESQRGLNSLEILSHLKAAYHMTGEERFQKAYMDLVQNHHYAINTIKQKITEPGHVNHSDDELAFLAYYPLLMYETDPDLRRIYTLSLERSWRIERPEACPLYNIIYAALTGRAGDIEATRRTLQEIPLDLVSWTMRNSSRSDVTLNEEEGRFGEAQSVVPVSPAERAVMKWNGNPYRLDGGNGGREEDDGTFFLLPYWMGRWYGLL